MHNLIKLAQEETFSTEVRLLKEGKLITKRKLLKLNAFIDKEDIIRVGGRLNNSEFNADKRHPIVLSVIGLQIINLQKCYF